MPRQQLLPCGFCITDRLPPGSTSVAGATQTSQCLVNVNVTATAGTSAASATLSGGGATCGFSSNGFVNAPAAPPPGVTFPHGFFQFTAASCPSAGGSITVTVTYPNPIPAGAVYYKYGKEPGNTTPHYFTIPATISGNTVTITLTDGQKGDVDVTADGTITDPGGPGLAGGADPTIIPTLSEYTLVALAALLMLGAMAQVRRQKR